MKLVYFSWIRERIEISEENVVLPAEVQTISDLFRWLASRGEEFQFFDSDANIRVALDREHAPEHNSKINDVGEIAFFPPMTGG